MRPGTRLSDAFDPSSTTIGEGEALEARLTEMLAEARASYPDLSVEPEAYVAYLAERCTGDALDALAAMDPGELYLVLACAHGDLRAQRTFEAHYFKEVHVGASRLRCSDDELDEVRQAVRRSLFSPGPDGRAALIDKTARGDFRALLRLMAIRAGISLRRRKGLPLVSDEALLEVADAEFSASGALLRAEHREKFRIALEAAIAELPAQDRTLLRLHEVDGVTLAALARMVQVDRSTITRRLARARAAIFAGTRAQLSERFGVGPEHFESFIDVIRSNFGASIRGLL